LHRAGKEGLGRAYLAGFRWGLEAGYGWIMEMDADLSHRPEDLPGMLAAAERHPVVVGSRYVAGRVTVVNWPIGRLLISLFGSWYARTITRVPVRDATGGFNCFRREVLEAIDFDRVESNGYAFQIELKLRAWRKGFEPVEVPIVFTERDTGESKMSKRIVREAVWKVWKLRFLDLAGRL
ncbi:MAG: glycosyltransferase, partial [Longimicrobiales bacterium]